VLQYHRLLNPIGYLPPVEYYEQFHSHHTHGSTSTSTRTVPLPLGGAASRRTVGAPYVDLRVRSVENPESVRGCWARGPTRDFRGAERSVEECSPEGKSPGTCSHGGRPVAC